MLHITCFGYEPVWTMKGDAAFECEAILAVSIVDNEEVCEGDL